VSAVGIGGANNTLSFPSGKRSRDVIANCMVAGVNCVDLISVG
jgi:hypothetical protein